MIRRLLSLALALGLLAGATHAQTPEYQVKISQLPVPASGSTYLSAGDIVGGNRNNITYGLIIGFGANCIAHQWVGAISPQGFGTCTQPSYSDISGLGTAATANTGVSGTVVPFLNGLNTWGGTQVFTGSIPTLTNGDLALGASSTAGGIIAGQGSTNDLTIKNKSGGSVCTVGTGAVTLNCTALSVTGISTLSGGLAGTTTADNPCSTCVGSYLSNTTTAGQAVTISTASMTGGNAAAIGLTPGDWNVWGTVYFNPGTTTTTTGEYGVVTSSSGTLPSQLAGGLGYSYENATLPAGGSTALNINPVRVSLATTTTYYLVGAALFATSTNGVFGSIAARRAR